MENTTQDIMTFYAPERQAVLTADRESAFLGPAPTLTSVAQRLGHEAACLWVASQLRDLTLFAGCSKITMQQIAATAEVITAMHGRLKLTELMYFFLHLKGGEWGGYYGLGNGMQVTSALNQFLAARVRIIDQLERDRQARQQQEQNSRREHWVNSYERYLQWRRDNGMGEPDLPWMRRPSGSATGAGGAPQGEGGAAPQGRRGQGAARLPQKGGAA